MDDVFKALADPSRRMLLDSLNAHNGQTLRQLCAGLDMARQSISKHLAVLEAGPTGRSQPGKGTGVLGWVPCSRSVVSLDPLPQ